MENIDNKYTLIQETDWGKYIAHSETVMANNKR